MELLDNIFDLDVLALTDLSDLPYDAYFIEDDTEVIVPLLIPPASEFIRGTPWRSIRGTSMIAITGSGPWTTIDGAASWAPIRGTRWEKIR